MCSYYTIEQSSLPGNVSKQNSYLAGSRGPGRIVLSRGPYGQAHLGHLDRARLVCGTGPGEVLQAATEVVFGLKVMKDFRVF